MAAVANLIAPYYKKPDDKIRMFVKKITGSDADMIKDEEKMVLVVRQHSLITARIMWLRLVSLQPHPNSTFEHISGA